MKKRASGILLHITSLPSAYGIGDMGPGAYRFVDWLKKSGQRYWQVLPITPTEVVHGNSPYSSPSAFAGNCLLISPDFLVREGLLKKKELGPRPSFSNRRVNYRKAQGYKRKILKSAFNNFRARSTLPVDYEKFCREQKYWLNDYALFTVLGEEFSGKTWNRWPKGIKQRSARALDDCRACWNLRIEEIRFYQYVFYRQWRALRAYANKRDVKIIGDIPIYVNFMSADAWANQRLFKLNKSLGPKFVAGVPPDYFSKTGQRWGNPVYDWAKMKRTRYGWWIKRVAHNLELFDFIRIDHFRGFAAYWQIPAREKTAVRGQWVKVPGTDFFRCLKRRFRQLPIIAEDVGYITPDVIKLRDRFNFPGTKIIQFAFDGNEQNPYLPKNYEKNCVVYTGTHDNNTIHGWYKDEIRAAQKDFIRRHLEKHMLKQGIHWAMIKLAMDSRAGLFIIPLQDVLGLGKEGRMNTPGTPMGNWVWRLRWLSLNTSVTKKLLKLTRAAKRL